MCVTSFLLHRMKNRSRRVQGGSDVDNILADAYINRLDSVR